MQPSIEMLGPLEVLRIKGESNAPTIVLFHGYGANAQDLFPLAQYIKHKPGTNWIFAQGPIDLGMGSRAWFHIDTAALEAAMASGSHRDLTDVNPPGLEESYTLARAMLAEIKSPTLYLGGFSQGGMLATEIALESDVALNGLFILSGTLLKKDRWQNLATRRKGLAFIQSHGKYDPLLSYADAEKLFALLQEAGLKGKFISFAGAHEIPIEVLEALSEFLNR